MISELKYPQLKLAYDKTNCEVEEMSERIFFVMVKVAPQTLTLPKLINSFIAYFFTHLDSDAFDLPLPMWFPFNWQNPIGYVIAFFLQYIIMLYVFLLTACLIIFTIGIYSFTINLIIRDVKDILNVINNCIRIKANRRHVLKKIIKFSQLHSDAKQFNINYSKSFKPIFLVIFVRGFSTIGIAMLLIQMEISQSENYTMLVLKLSVEMFWAFGSVFIACELSDRVSNAFNETNDMVNQFAWYLFPIQVKRLLPIIIMNTQQPIIFECFGSIRFSRETFKKVANKGFSYFMVLRKFYE